MAHTNPGRSLPLLLSLAAHGLILLIVYTWPAGRQQIDPAVADTRITVDLVDREEGPSGEPRPHGRPEESEESFTPRIEMPPLPAPPTTPAGPPAPAPAPGGTTGTPGGDGGGGAGGEGRGLFPAASVRRVVYVLDRSLSMGPSGALDVARAELLAGLHRLPPSARFQVIVYNGAAELLATGPGDDLLAPDPDTLGRVALALENLAPRGDTDHRLALNRGLSLGPEVLYLVTDDDDLPPAVVPDVTRANRGRTRIHAIELTPNRAARPDSALRQLAEANGGTYRRVVLGGGR